MFLAVIAFTISSFRHYIMFNHQNYIEEDNEEDDETSKTFYKALNDFYMYLFM